MFLLSEFDILILLKIELGDILKIINLYFKLYNNRCILIVYNF